MKSKTALASLRLTRAACLALSSALTCVSFAHADPAVEEAEMLDRIVVESGKSGSGWKGAPLSVYQTPGTIGIIGRDSFTRLPGRDAQDIFDDVAGVVAESRPDNPGLNISIRGLSDQNRITMAIDGARQNFLQNGHGQAASAYLDPMLMRRVELDKVTGADALSAGSLGGYVNFRTLLSEDLIDDGRTFGGQANVMAGSNAYRPSGSGAFSWRLAENIAVTAAISHKKVGKYEPGKKYPFQFDDNYFSTRFVGSQTLSGLLKTEIDIDNDQKLTLGWVGYGARFQTGDTALPSRSDARNHTFTAQYTYNPDNNLIDLSANLWTNRLTKHDHRAKRQEYGAFDNRYGLNTTGGDIANRSKVTTGFGDLTFDYGATAFFDNARTKQFAAQVGDDPTGSWFTGATPAGKRNYYSAFSSIEFKPANYQWLSVTGGLRYDRYDLNGKTLALDMATQDFKNIDVEKHGGRLLPSVKLGIAPIQGLQFFAGYDHAYRPPTAMETLIYGAHIGNYGPPRVPNPYLLPEAGKTAQVGFNVTADDLLLGGDSLRFKYAYFHRTIDKEIFLTVAPIGEGEFASQYMNADTAGRMRGHEIEANYDAGHFYLGGSLSVLNHKPGEKLRRFGDETLDLAKGWFFAMPPKYKLTLDAGIRLFEEKLTLGAKLRRTGKVTHRGHETLTAQLWSRPFTVGDVYGSYEFDKDRRVDFGVDNVMDRYYVDYMSHIASPGRTYKINFSTRF